MSRRIAHRPRHHLMRNYSQPPLRSHKEYLRTRWTYRRQALPYSRHPLGHGLMVLSSSRSALNPLRLLPALPRFPSFFKKPAVDSLF
jgi:hypothetical protein